MHLRHSQRGCVQKKGPIIVLNIKKSVLPQVLPHPENCCPVQQSETPQKHSSSLPCVRMRNGEKRWGRPWRWHRRRQTHLSAHKPSRKETNACVSQTVNRLMNLLRDRISICCDDTKDFLKPATTLNILINIQDENRVIMVIVFVTHIKRNNNLQ